MMTLRSEKKILLCLKKNPHIYLVLSKLTLLIYRSCLWSQNFTFLYWLAMTTIFFEFFHFLFINRIMKSLKKLYFLTNLYTILVHLIQIFFVPSPNLEFFLGIETLIVIYLNFKEIKNKFLRYIVLGFLTFAFFKKFADLEIRVAEFIYFSYALILFEHALRTEDKAVGFKSTSSKRGNSIFEVSKSSKKTFSLKSSANDADKTNDQKILESNEIPWVEPLKALNLVNIAHVVINQDFIPIFANDYSFEFFQTKSLEEIKKLLFSLEENTALNKSYSSKFPELGLKNIFDKSFQKKESINSSKMDEVSEKYEFKRILIDEIPENKSLRQKEQDWNFKRWKKKILSENLDNSILDHEKKNIQPSNVFKFLNKLFRHIGSKEIKNSNRAMNHNDSRIKGDSETNFCMYAKLKCDGKDDLNLMLNFYPINVILLKNEVSAYKLLISIRELNDIEKKYMEELNSKNKMLGSFCHELRTPIHGIINMLDMMQAQFEEIKLRYERLGEELEDLLSNSVISSHLLLNQIDDFIDYFSFSNEMTELHIKGFDFNSFLNDIFRIFSHVAKKKKITFSIVIDENIPAIIFNDHQKLRRIIFNLINNSLRFTNSGGIIKVRAKLRKRNFIRISVYDTGSGIKPEDFHSLGRINNNIHDLHKTTCGFGLFISTINCLLIERSDFDKKKGLTVYSDVGVGTCFSFSFRCDINSETSDNEKGDKGRAAYRNTISLGKKDIKIFSISSSECIGDKGLFPSKENKRVLFPQKEEKRFNLDLLMNRTRSLNPDQNCLEEKQNLLFLTKESMNFGSPSKLESCTNIFDCSFSGKECDCTKVLIVDDGLFNIEACSKLLAKMKISCDSASNGLEAVEKIILLTNNFDLCPSINSEITSNDRVSDSSFPEEKENGKNSKFCSKCRFYKLILMDIDMPIKNGIEATEEILSLLKKYDLSVKIVGLSAFDQEDIVKRSMEAGMVDFITKPIKHSKLKEIISQYISVKV